MRGSGGGGGRERGNRIRSPYLPVRLSPFALGPLALNKLSLAV